MPDLLGPTPPPRSARTRRPTRDERKTDALARIKTACNLREIAYEQADRADGQRRTYLLRRAAINSVQEARARLDLAKVAPGCGEGRGDA